MDKELQCYGLMPKNGVADERECESYTLVVWNREALDGDGAEICRRLGVLGQAVDACELMKAFRGKSNDGRLTVVMQRENSGIMGFVSGIADEADNFLIDKIVVLDGRSGYTSDELWGMILEGFGKAVKERQGNNIYMRNMDPKVKELLISLGWGVSENGRFLYRSLAGIYEIQRESCG